MRLIIGLLFFVFVNQIKAQFLMSNAAVTIVCPSSNTFYDSGNSGGTYAINENFTKTFTSNNGSCLQFAFTTFTTESCCDRLKIFDGPNGSSPLIGTFSGNSSPGTIISSGSSLTFSWTSDGSIVANGWAANISCVAPCSGAPAAGTTNAAPSSGSVCTAYNSTITVSGSTSGCGISYQWQSATALGGPYANISGAVSATYTQNISATTFFRRVTTCGASSATSTPASTTFSCNGYVQSNTNETLTCPPTFSLFYDSGGPSGLYSNSENLTKTFTSSNGYCLQFAFNTFSVESCCDKLMIFDGPSGASPLIGTYAGLNSPGTVISSGSSLTFSFTSDGSINQDGWDATISCLAPCVGAPAAGTATANPNNITCSSYNTTLSVNGSPSGCGITHQWQSASSLGGPYANIAGATAATYTLNVNSTTYFRRITSCGGSSSTSSPATASISCNGYIQGTNTETLTCPPALNFFYDSKGPSATYGVSENSTKTFVSSNGNCLQFAFTTFTTESCCDKLSIYDGPNGASPLIGTYSGGNSPGTIVSSGSSITFSFTSDGSIVYDGWEATISCLAPCTGTPNSGTAFATPSSSCASFITKVDVSGSAPGCGMTYQWQSATAVGGPYANIAGATRSTYTQNITSTTFFRRITTCGAASATSAVGSASISIPTISCDLNTYTASSTTYSFETFSGTALPTTDDVLFSAVTNFGFNFCFGGQQFSGGYVASNSAFVFDAFPCNPNISTNTFAAPGVSTGYVISQAAPKSNVYYS